MAVEAIAVVLAVIAPRAELTASALVLSADDGVGPAATAGLGHGDGRAASWCRSRSRDTECDDGGGARAVSWRFMGLLYLRSFDYPRAPGDAQAPIRVELCHIWSRHRLAPASPSFAPCGPGKGADRRYAAVRGVASLRSGLSRSTANRAAGTSGDQGRQSRNRAAGRPLGDDGQRRSASASAEGPPRAAVVAVGDGVDGDPPGSY